MNKERRILLIILFFSVVVSLSFINVFTLKDRSNNLNMTINITEKKYNKLAVNNPGISEEYLSRLMKLIEEEKSGYFSINDVNPYIFGQEIKALLELNNINVKSYKTTEKDNLYIIEFSVDGTPYNYFSFFNSLYKTGKNYKIPYLTIQNEKTGISSIFKIGYSIYE